MAQLSFSDAPELDTHIDFSDIKPGERIADLDVARRLHRSEFQPMQPNNRGDGALVVYRIKPAALPAPILAPAHQTLVESPEVRVLIDQGQMSRERMLIRVAESKAVNALVLSGAPVVQAL